MWVYELEIYSYILNDLTMRNKMSQNLYLNRINTFAEFQNKMKAFEEHIEMMVGEKEKPCPLHLIIVPGERGVGKTLTVRKMEKK